MFIRYSIWRVRLRLKIITSYYAKFKLTAPVAMFVPIQYGGFVYVLTLLQVNA
jgi:hypothetical protein